MLLLPICVQASAVRKIVKVRRPGSKSPSLQSSAAASKSHAAPAAAAERVYVGAIHISEPIASAGGLLVRVSFPCMPLVPEPKSPAIQYASVWVSNLSSARASTGRTSGGAAVQSESAAQPRPNARFHRRALKLRRNGGAQSKADPPAGRPEQ